MSNKIRIKSRKIVGTVSVPPSKSMAHRAVICASLAKGRSIISNLDLSDDIIATMNAMKSLGANIEELGNKSFAIDGSNTFKNKKDNIVVDCNESGSTLRFLVPLAIAEENKVKFIGRGNLGKRPLNIFYDIFDRQGIKYSYEEGVLNLDIDGALKGEIFNVAGNISSQFISGLMFTLPLLREDSKIVITTELESKGYLDLTLSMLKSFGIEVINNDYKEFIIKGNQNYKAFDYEVEGDYSQAAFYLSAGAIGNNVDIKNLDLYSLQGDKEVIEILENLGNRLVIENKRISIKSCKGEESVIDAKGCPDVIPVVAVAAALTKGTTKIINAGRLRIKECDRLHAITTELNKLGAKVTELEDSLVIEGVETLKGGEVSSYDDHRIAMSIAIASTRCEGDVILENPACVSKSYPHFWEDFKMLGGEIDEWNMGE
ncbi:MAG: 3-phosphoshikimate 1-carboxyvinyltransferase [Sarcina sp.]